MEPRGRTQDGNGDGSGGGNERRRGDGDGDGDGDGFEDGNGNANGEGKGRGGKLWYLPHRQNARVEDQTPSFRTRYDLYRQEVAPAGSQQLRAQDPAPARRCGTEVRKGHQGREGGTNDENRDVGGDGGNTSTGMSTRVGMVAGGTEAGTGERVGTITEMRVKRRESPGWKM